MRETPVPCCRIWCPWLGVPQGALRPPVGTPPKSAETGARFVAAEADLPRKPFIARVDVGPGRGYERRGTACRKTETDPNPGRCRPRRGHGHHAVYGFHRRHRVRSGNNESRCRGTAAKRRLTATEVIVTGGCATPRWPAHSRRRRRPHMFGWSLPRVTGGNPCRVGGGREHAPRPSGPTRERKQQVC